MELSNQNILFFTRTMTLGGTENVVLQLCEILKPSVHKVVVCSCGGVHTEKLDNMGIRPYKIPDIERKTLPVILKVLRQLKYIIKKEKITVIHTHHRMAAFYVSVLRLYKKCIFLNTSHNTFYDKKILTKFAYKNAHLIACGDKVRQNLIDIYGFKNIVVIHNAVKPFEKEVTADKIFEKLKSKDNFLIGNIGRLSEQKGMKYFIEAIPIVAKASPKARFFIVGNGEDENKLKKYAKELGVENILLFMGYRTDIQNIMKQLDLVVLSSLWEGLPLTPIEAFSVGKTIVATSVDGTTEIIDNQKNGLLVKARDSEELAQKIIWMINHPNERQKMEKFALNKYNEKFSFQKYYKIL